MESLVKRIQEWYNIGKGLNMKFRKSYKLQVRYEVLAHNKTSLVESLIETLLDLDLKGCYITEKRATNIAEQPYGDEGAVFYVSTLELTFNILNPIKAFKSIKRARNVVDFVLKVQSESISLAITQHRDRDHFINNGDDFDDA